MSFVHLPFSVWSLDLFLSLHSCKMELTSLHDFHGSWHLYICCSLFGHSTFFVASLVLLKGTSCCVIRRNCKWNWAVRSCYGKVLWVIGLHDFRCYLLSLRGICHVFMHCFDSFLLQAMFLSLHVFAFVEFLYSKSLANLFYSCVKRFPSSSSIRHSVRHYWSSIVVMKTK